MSLAPFLLRHLLYGELTKNRVKCLVAKPQEIHQFRDSQFQDIQASLTHLTEQLSHNYPSFLFIVRNWWIAR